VSPTTVTTTIGGGASQTSLASTPSNNGNNRGSSNTGTKIGIGVGVGGGVLFILACIGFAFYLRKKRGGREVHTDLDRAGDIGVGKAELPGATPGYSEQKNVSMESGYPEGGGATTVYPGLLAGQRLSEMP
jgi:hypothetical protein